MQKQESVSEAEESNRMWASASFVGVLFIIGVPLWWKTTEVYRVSLPYAKINDFNTENHFITTELTVLANDDRTAADVARDIEIAFKESDVIKLKINYKILSADLQHTLNSVAEEQEVLEELDSKINIKKPNNFYVVQRKPLFRDVWVGSERVAFFRDVKALPTLIEALQNWIYEPSVLSGSRSELPDTARQVRFPPGEYHVVLSVIHPTPHLLKVEFNTKEAVEDYIGSFVDELSELHNFTLKSQWLYQLDFDFEVRDISGPPPYKSVSASRLPLLLTRLEARAAHVGERAAVHAALYAVPCHVAPLVVEHDNRIQSPVQAFISPKWGAVILGNPTREECEQKIYQPDVNVIMGTFVAQLRKLLGITDKEPIQKAHLEALRSVSPRAWEIDSLLRIRTLEQVTSAERSLKSLSKLLGEISNIVINDEVGASINQAVISIEKATKLMENGDLLSAQRRSKEAFLEAESAFMEPSLLTLLYFPDDQKYAIYIPLFLPIMFPVVLSMKNLYKWFRGKPVHKEKTE